MARDLKLNFRNTAIRDFQWRIAVGALVLFSGFTNFWGLKDVERSEYYAATTKSMSLNLSNFIFGSMDPGGTISIDKIPGSFWIPAILVKLFGFNTLLITLPSAITAIAATLVITFVIKKYYGRTAGLIAGSILATTPIVVAIARTNQPYGIYFFTIAMAIRFSIIALNENSRRHLIWAGLWIGIAFHTYMLLAWVLWPPLIIGYLCTSQSLKNKIQHLSIAGFVSLFSSSLWLFVVQFTPASQRPYLGGTNNNSALEMVFGYNGFGRFTDRLQASTGLTSRTFTPPFGGDPGVFRFFNTYLMGQITWLLLTSIISMFLLIYLKEKSPTFIFASAYLLIQIIIFSMVQGMHQFYVATISLPIAIIISMAVREFANKKKPIFIISVMTVSVFSAFFITLKVQHFYFLSPFFQLLLFLTFIALSITPVRRIPKNTASAVFILAIILTPAIWSVDTIRRSDPFNPMAGPTYSELALEKFNKTSNKLGGIVNQREFIKIEPEEYQKVVKYIRSKTNSKFALATFNGAAAPFITSTTDLIYPVGGFNGQDPEPSLSKFVSQVSNGEIRFVLADSDSQGGIKSENQTRIQEWVRDNCINDPYEKSGFRLFDCKQS